MKKTIPHMVSTASHGYWTVVVLTLIFFAINVPESMAASKAKSLKEQGDFLYYHGDVDDAIEKFEQAIQLEPDMVEAHMSLVNLYLLRKRQDKAIEHAREVVKLDPGSAGSHMLLANLLRSKKDKSEAIKEYESAIELGVKDTSVRTGLGYLYMENNQLKKALNCFEAAKLEKRASYNAFVGAAIAKYRLGKKSSAIADMDALIKEHGPISSFLTTKGHLLLGMGKTKGALAAYEAALESDPDDASLHTKVGDLYYKQGHKLKAEKSFSKAIKYNPNNSNAHYSLGIIKQKSNRIKEAAQHFEDGAQVEKNEKTRRKMLLHSRRLKLKAGLAVGKLVDLDLVAQPVTYPKSNVFGFSYSDLLNTPDSKWKEMSRVVENAKNIKLNGGKGKLKIKIPKPHMVPGRMH